ncbi:MAG: type II secretion system secretin GspD [Desulfuromonadia bacterium]
MKRLFITILILLTLASTGIASPKGVVINFTDVDISTLVKFISDLTGKNFVLDERVKGKITIYSPTKLSPQDAYAVFTSVLELKGFTIIPSGKTNKIIPTSAVRQSGVNIAAAAEPVPPNETYSARIISLDYISSQEAMTFLQPLVSKDGHISAFGPGNLLLLIDSNPNIEKILGILELVDTDQARKGGEILFLSHASAESTAKIVSDWLGVKAKPGAGVTGASTPSPVIADPRLNALILFTKENERQAIKRLVSLIDVPPPTASGKVNVYYLENADAVETAKVLEGVVKGLSPTPQGQPTAVQGSPLDGRITVTPDKATNSLVIMASPADYQSLVEVIRKLDRRRRQVFVEAVVAEISLDRLSELGVQWGAMGGGSTGSVTAAGVYDPQGTFAPLLSSLASLKGAGISIPDITGTALNFSVILKALNSTGALNVLSTPTILTSDNKEAEIFVGENVPFRGKVEISTTTNPSLQSIERKDTGLTLKLTPQISEGEFVKMDLYQEISAVKDATFSGAADLVTTKRTAKTSVVVKDGETVAIGGLIQDKEQESVSKVPLLGDIPLLGWLFKSSSKKREKTNLLILLTPKIIREPGDLTSIRKERQSLFDEGAKGVKRPKSLPLPPPPSPSESPAPSSTPAGEKTP